MMMMLMMMMLMMMLLMRDVFNFSLIQQDSTTINCGLIRHDPARPKSEAQR